MTIKLNKEEITHNLHKNKIVQFAKKCLFILKQWKGLVVFINVEKMQNNALEWTKDITSRGGVFAGTGIPKDFVQSNPRTILTSRGKLTSGYVLFNDWNQGEDAGITQLFIALAIVVLVLVNALGIELISYRPSLMELAYIVGALIVLKISSKLLEFTAKFYTFYFYALGFYGLYYLINLQPSQYSRIISAFAYFLPIAVMLYLSYAKDQKRAFQLTKQQQEHGGTLTEKFIKDDETNNPLLTQIRTAALDTSPFIPLGIATGRFKANGDINAPDAGTEIGFTRNDASQHILIVGKSGIGKSYVLRHIAERTYTPALANDESVGMAIFDGKAELGQELSPILDAIISPDLVKRFNILTGLRPEQKVSILLTANEDNGSAGANQIFKNGGAEIAFYAALAQDKLVEMRHLISPEEEAISSSFNYWEKLGGKLVAEGKVSTDGTISHPIINLLAKHPNAGTDKSIQKIVDFIMKYQGQKERELIDSFLSNFYSWMSKITQNTRLYDWADSETSDIHVEDILKGKKYAVALKTEDYGPAGRIITQFIKASLFNSLALRNSNWMDDKEQTKVLMMIDECQDIITEDDVDQSQKARSRGMIMVYATQHLTNLITKLGSTEKAMAFVLSFSSYLVMKTDDKVSQEFMSDVLGKIRVIVSSAKSGPPIDFIYSNKLFMNNPEFDSSHPESHFIKFNGSKVKATGFRFGKKNDKSELDETGLLATYNIDPNQPVRDLYSAEDQKRLEVPRHAVLRVQRAGMSRADIIKVHGISVDELAEKVKVAKSLYKKRVKEAA